MPSPGPGEPVRARARSADSGDGSPRRRDEIALRLPPGAAPAGRRIYRIAGRRLVSELALDRLAPFEEHGPWTAAPRCRAPGDDGAGTLLFGGDGWVGGRLRRVECRAAGGGYRLEVAGAGRFEVGADGAVDCLWLDPGAPPDLVAETLLGPALILALGLHGVFCLHAAAVVREGRAAVLVGPSGCGKSTLAAGLARAGEWRRIADDVLPVEPASGGPVARPDFPQLKLAAAAQTVGGSATPLGALYLLAPPAGGRRAGRAMLRPLPAHEAALALARHTVAARLFGPALLAGHLAACAAIAERVPVSRLVYPHHAGSIAAVAGLLAGPSAMAAS